jgi:putative AlgH/UPF0301 family transcriptional regulator
MHHHPSSLSIVLDWTSTMAASKSLIVRRLYRSLLKASRPFDDSSAFACLIHRTGMEDDNFAEVLRADLPSLDDDDDDDDDDGLPPHHKLFQKLLREFVSGEGTLGIRTMQFPSQRAVKPQLLGDMIRREFKCPAEQNQHDNDSTVASSSFPLETRREVAFMALRELNKKIAWADRLLKKAPTAHPDQAARWVAPLPLDPSAYLQKGCYLIANPHMTGYFRRTVICILDNQEGSLSSYGTYGLIVNRVCVSPQSGRNLTLEEIVRPLPTALVGAFGGFLVKEGGPVHMSIQMMYAASTDGSESSSSIGGTLLPMIPANDEDSTAFHSDRATYYKGDIMKAAEAINGGQLDREEVSFYVGASCWSLGQLESEIERGFWLPCRGPPEIALTGICEHEPTEKGKPRPKADLWLSMLSACGEEEAELAHLVWPDDGEDECGYPCDDFQ